MLGNCVATDLRQDLIISEFEAQKIEYLMPNQNDKAFEHLFSANFDSRLTWICVTDDDKDRSDKIYSELRTHPCSEKCCRKSWRNIGEVEDRVFLSDRNSEVTNLLTAAGITFDVIEGSCTEIKGVEWCRQDIQWRNEDDAHVKSILKENNLWYWQVWQDCPDGI